MMKYSLPLTLSLVVIVLSIPCSAQPKESFEDWLESYGAWDRLEQQYASEATPDSPEALLKRAVVYLNLNSPRKALDLIEMTTPFSDNATEVDRLWIGGRAHRAMGDLTKAVLWFSQSTLYVDSIRDLRNHFKNEPQLQEIWKDVWLKMYWSFDANTTISRQSQSEALERILSIGMEIWGDNFWRYGKQALSGQLTPPAVEQQIGSDGIPLPPLISDADSQVIARALAAVSLERTEEAQSILTSIRNPVIQQFWISIVDYITTAKLPVDLNLYSSNNYIKAYAFWDGNILAPYSSMQSKWFIGNPESSAWTQFRNNLLTMSADEADKAINAELNSMLISNQTAQLLNDFKLALSVYNGDFIASARTWNSISKKRLPLTLKVAGTLLFKDSLSTVLPDQAASAFVEYPILRALCGGAGYDLDSITQAPFWTSIPASKLDNASEEQWPLDRLLLLANWQNQFSHKPTSEIAKRSAYLFDDTAFGADCLLYLADQKVDEKSLQLAAYYLNKVRENELDSKRKMMWLDAKTRLEFDSGRPDAALKTYQSMLKLDQSIPVMTRLRVALLYQQRRMFDMAKEELLTLWKNKDSMSTTLQAETLFWLGEGEQALKNSQKALDYYLLLAWQYPQENIWALTAMYRASLIYEMNGKYDTAKRLLTTVVKRADRKEQREAAKARIDAINKKSGASRDSKANSTLVYPF